jgi:hypothetical protein
MFVKDGQPGDLILHVHVMAYRSSDARMGNFLKRSRIIGERLRSKLFPPDDPERAPYLPADDVDPVSQP